MMSILHTTIGQRAKSPNNKFPAQKTFSETYSCNYPLIDDDLLDADNLIYSIIDKKIYKDNREITKITIQDEYLSDDPDAIIVGKSLIGKNIRC